LSLSENILDFSVENTASSHSTPPSTGIGLENVQRRLDLLYPQKHELHIQQANELFRIHLHLDLT
jgi:LytS/YehU family sensor histidine kinase